MKPLKLKSTASLRLRLGYLMLFTMFAAAFISSTARTAFPHTSTDPGNAIDTKGPAPVAYSGFATIRKNTATSAVNAITPSAIQNRR